jgi:hypothetical protein
MRRRVAGVALSVAGLALIGCGTGVDQTRVRAATERFYSAVQQHDGKAACALLSSDTASRLVKDEQASDCPSAVTKLNIRGSRAQSVAVYATSAVVKLDSGERVFLGWTPLGWEIDAVGCKVTGSGPLDCEESS